MYKKKILKFLTIVFLGLIEGNIKGPLIKLPKIYAMCH